MTITTNTWVTLTAATVLVPASSDGAHRAERTIVGIGLFIAQHENGRWRFARHAHAIPAGEPESTLLEQAADRIPANGTLIGWNIDHGLMPALLDAAATAPPVIAHHFLARLHRLLRGGALDMALGHGGGGAPSLATIAADMAIYTPVWDADAIVSDWATGCVDQLRRDLADEALAIWRVFIRSAGLDGIDAETATTAWVARREKLRAVKRADGAN